MIKSIRFFLISWSDHWAHAHCRFSENLRRILNLRLSDNEVLLPTNLQCLSGESYGIRSEP
ncbi:hypothetical protein RHMOL_Rhmol06G0211600 [Rhododendron molle]|uniref:Uncharacterized protein n=1 Tax=Rhododendron molle TaxID=49168 RepID=A0ACC0NF92_RHOML|nr:hypothetical protein RHMOL_Rhmol06G0211600 [Rhododendron molle]